MKMVKKNITLFLSLFYSLTTISCFLISGLFTINLVTIYFIVFFISITLIINGKQFFINVLLCMSTFNFIFISFEIILRIYFSNLVFYRPLDRLHEKSPTQKNVSKFIKNKSVSQWTYGDLSAKGISFNKSHEPRKVLFQTDQYGFRNSKNTLRNNFDLVLAGDSFVTGAGTDQNDIFSSLLENKSLKVYNLGVPGNIYDSYSHLYYNIDRLKNKDKTTLCLFFFSGNDLDTDYIFRELDYFSYSKILVNKIKNFRKKSILLRLTYRFNNKKVDNNVIERKIKIHYLSFYKKYELSQYYNILKKDQISNTKEKSLKGLFSSINKIDSLSELSFKDFFIFYIPTKYEVYEKYITGVDPQGKDILVKDLLFDFTKKKNINFYDLTPDFILESDKLLDSNKFSFWKDDTHINQYGHKIISDIVFKKIVNIQDF